MDSQELDYPAEWITARFQHSRYLLLQVNMTLLGKTGRMWERKCDLLPDKKVNGHQ